MTASLHVSSFLGVVMLGALCACSGEAPLSTAPRADDGTAAAAAPSAPASPATPSGAFDERSLFLLELGLEDQSGEPFALVSRRGQPVLVTFFYASCDTMCPLVVSDLRRVEATLSPAARAALRVVLVTIDPERDDAARLRAVAAERDLPLDRWSLVRGSERDVRTLASTLGMTYRRTTDGEYAHAALFTVLDGEGRVVVQTSGTGRAVTSLVDGIEALVAPEP